MSPWTWSTTTLDAGLRDEGSVERVAMVHRQRAGLLGVGGRERQQGEAHVVEEGHDVRDPKTAGGPLDRDLPEQTVMALSVDCPVSSAVCVVGPSRWLS